MRRENGYLWGIWLKRQDSPVLPEKGFMKSLHVEIEKVKVIDTSYYRWELEWKDQKERK